MAKDAKAPAPEAGEAPPKKSKKLLIIIVAAVLLVVLIGGGAAFFLLKKNPEEQGDEEEVTEQAKPKKAKKKDKEAHPIFINLEPFTVNLLPENGDQYLQVVLSVELEDPAAEQGLRTAMPKVRNDVTLLLSSKKASELLTKEGKEHLAEDLKEAINEAIDPPKRNKRGEKMPSDPTVKEVLFTSFIIQ